MAAGGNKGKSLGVSMSEPTLDSLKVLGDADIGDAATDLIGFHGATAVDQGAALTTQLTSITIADAAGTPDYALQALTTTSPYGLATLAEAVSLLYVIQNLQVRMAEVEQRLEEKGLVAAN